MVVWALFRANIFVRVLFRGLFWATFAWALFGALFGEGFRDFRDYETFMQTYLYHHSPKRSHNHHPYPSYHHHVCTYFKSYSVCQLLTLTQSFHLTNKFWTKLDETNDGFMYWEKLIFESAVWGLFFRNLNLRSTLKLSRWKRCDNFW